MLPYWVFLENGSATSTERLPLVPPREAYLHRLRRLHRDAMPIVVYRCTAIRRLLSPDLAYGLSCYGPLHNIWYGIFIGPHPYNTGER